MPNQVTIDTSKLKAKLKALSAVAPVATRTLLKHQTSLMVKELVKQSLPDKGRSDKNVESTVNRAFIKKRKGQSTVTRNSAPFNRYLLARYHRRSGRKMHITTTAYNAFLKNQKALRGLLAKGWLAGASKLQVSGTNTLAKNSPSYGTYQEQFSTLLNKIVLHNLVAYGRLAKLRNGGSYPQLVQNVVNRRVREVTAMLNRWKGKEMKYSLPAWLRD